MVKVSVIIPVYNVEKTLGRCVDSVLSQSFTDYEIILVDDGSPDRSGEMCDEYDRKYNSITVIHKKNGGLSDARNAGLKAARGEYVMFLDSDDYLSEDCLEVLSAEDADLVIGMHVKVRSDGSVRSKLPLHSPKLIKKECFAEEFPSLLESERLNYVHGKLYKRAVITQYQLEFEDDMLTSAEDTVYNFTFLRFCTSIFLAEKYIHYYVFNSNGLARKYYPDRYQRVRRLRHFLADSVQVIGIRTDQMQKVLDERTVLTAAYALKDMQNTPGLPTAERRRFAEEIYQDEELRGVLHCSVRKEYRGSAYEQLLLLMEIGSGKYVADLNRKQRKEQMKRAQNRALTYPKEVLYRLHILKRTK